MTIQRRPGGGDNDTAREVEQYGDNQFIDASGEAKLIYTVVSEPGTGTNGTVKITDMARDPKSSSFATFPSQVTDGTNTYNVVGNSVESYQSKTDRFIDTEGDYKLIYKKTSTATTATIIGISYEGDDAIPITFPAYITIDGTNYPVSDVNFDSGIDLSKISELTFIISFNSGTYKLNQSFPNCANLTSVKFVVDKDDPNVTDPKNAGYVDIGSAFIGCTNLKTLTLPNVLHRASYAFAGCTGLGSSEDDPLIFNSYLRTSTGEAVYIFAGCTGLKYLEIGKNVNMIDSIFSPCTYSEVEYSGCSGIRVIYNTNTTITESVIASTILQSGSSNVLLFNNPGGEFTQRATFSDTNIITMPEGTLGGVDIPTWSHKDGFSMYSSGKKYEDFSPWSTIPQEYSHYYYALYGSCTITYNVTYHDSTTNTNTTDTRYQTVVCMYNTPLYDIDNYGAKGDTIYDKMVAKNDLKWTSSVTIPTTDISYNFGQSVTLFYDLDLYLYLDDITTKEIKVTYTWDYIEKSTDSLPVLKTFTHQGSH